MTIFLNQHQILLIIAMLIKQPMIRCIKNLLPPQIYFGIIMEKELIGLNHILRSVTYHIKEMTFI